MTNEEINEIRERCNAATPGPWAWIRENDIDLSVKISIYEKPTFADIKLLYHAREDIPVLLTEIERLQCELDMVNSTRSIEYVNNLKNANTKLITECELKTEKLQVVMDEFRSYEAATATEEWDRLQAEIERLTRERDAAVADMKYLVINENPCDVCGLLVSCDAGDDLDCVVSEHWQWRGVQEATGL